MKYIQEKDKKKRKDFSISENKEVSLKFLSRNNRLISNLQDKSYINTTNLSNHIVNKNLFYFTHNHNSIAIKNRCIFTNRSKSVYRFGRISRIKFRSYSSFGYFTGITKSSW